MRLHLAIAALLFAGASVPGFVRAQAPGNILESDTEAESPAEAEPVTEPEEAAEAEPEPEPEADATSDEAEETEPEPADAAESAPEAEEPEPEPEAEPEPDVPQGGDELPPEMRQVVDDTEGMRQPEEAVAQPMRIVGRLGVGGALRLISHDELQQDRLAPSYLNLQGALVLPLTGSLRHSVLVGASTNLEPDGSFVTGIDPFQQWVFEVGYGLHVPFGRPGAPTWLVGGHVSGALVASPDLTWGVEIGGDAAYHFLAGLGVYAEVNLGTYIGAEDRFGKVTVNPLLALEIGLTWDYEVLP